MVVSVGMTGVERLARGQALVEFLVLALALLPLFLLMPMIAKYQDVAHAAQMASRYVSFESMTRNAGAGSWKPEAQLAQQARRRFFGNSDAPIKTDDGAGNFPANQNLFWRSPGQQALIADIGRDVTLHFGTASGTAHRDGYSAADDGLPFNLVGAAAQRMGLQSDGIYTAQVDVALLNLPAGLKNYAPFDSINLTMKRHTSVLVDAWTASNPGQVESRIDHPVLFPGALLAPARQLVDPVIGVVELFHVPGPGLGELAFWRDVVPADRLK
jgi:hypothetical protein